MKYAFNDPIFKISSLILATLIAVVLCFGCHPKAGDAKETVVLPDANIERLISTMPLGVCMDCKYMAEVRAYEKGLGSKQIVLSDGEYSKAFRGDCYTTVLEEDATDDVRDTSWFKSWNQYFEFYARPRRNDSLPMAVVCYYYYWLDREYGGGAVQFKTPNDVPNKWQRSANGDFI